MNHIMIDLETLGLQPNAVITQISAIAFDLHPLIFGQSFNRYINIQSHLDDGAIIEGEALLFTVKNNTQSILSEDRQNIRNALTEFIGFVNSQRPLYIWAKSPQFDCIKLEWWFNKYKVSPPWTYDMLRDVRTLQWASFKDFTNLYNEYRKFEHNALVDCEYQIKVLSDCMDSVKIVDSI